MQETYSGSDKRIKYLFDNASEVNVTQTLQGGTKIASISVDGNSTDLYAPSGGGGGGSGDVSYETNIANRIETYEEQQPGGAIVKVYDAPSFKSGYVVVDDSNYPVFTPPALGVEYVTNYNQGILVGTLVVRTITQDPEDEESTIVAHKDTFEIIVPTGGGGGGSVVSWNQIVQSGTKIATVTINGNSTDVYAPSGGGSTVFYTPILESGTQIGTLTIDGVDNPLYAPSGGGGSVDDVLVNNESVVDEGIARIDLTGYQTSLQNDIDRIYNVCVGMGVTPPSHGFADVMLTALYVIGGNMQYTEVQSTLNMNMRYFGHAKEVE